MDEPPAIRCFRNSRYVSSRLLSRKCEHCFGDIDTGREYWSWAGLVLNSFYWYYKHDHCHGYGASA